VATAKAVLDQIISHGMVIRGWFGAEYTDPAMLAPGRPVNGGAQPGVVVLEVLPGGPADVAGVRSGDVLLKLDGEDIVDQADLRSHEAALAPGKTAQLEGLRNGAPFSVKLTLMQRPPNVTVGS
jgi:serine protease DegS/serine protease DegQ